jgi:DNA modification methylase
MQWPAKLPLNRVTQGDCRERIPELPDDSIDIVVTSPPYWGQRVSAGAGMEDDPRDYVRLLIDVFIRLLPKLKTDGILWINLGDAYNTPVNWRTQDRRYSSLGPTGQGLPATNSAYIKPRAKRKSFVDPHVGWLRYGNLLALPYRLILGLCDAGYLFRGEVIWRKRNPMPEGRCRRPHRHHEGLYLLARSDRHRFRTRPPVRSVWEFAHDKIDGAAHHSRFPEELPDRCIEAYGASAEPLLVLDPFAGSGTTGLAALKRGNSFVGFEIDARHVAAANERLADLESARGAPH